LDSGLRISGCAAAQFQKTRMPSIPIKAIEVKNLPKDGKQVQIEVATPPKQ
jgi:hypothetical protein